MAKPRHMYQVFISSTFTDLEHERALVTWEILKARLLPSGMEGFPAGDDRGWKTIQRTIDDSDYYVLVLAGRYGSFDESIGMSWTEREYNYAVSKGIPVLPFLRDLAATPGNAVDKDENATRLEAFIKKVRGRHLTAGWKTKDDLATNVVQALQRAIHDDEADGNPRPGWTRGDLGGPEVAAEIARLSKENAELRAKLEAVGDVEKKPKLVLLLNGDAVADVWEPELTQYVPGASKGTQLNFMTPTTNDAAFAAFASRTLWIKLEVGNPGLAPARNVKVTATLEASVGTLGDTIINRFTRESLLGPSVAAEAGKWRFDPAEPTYVSRHGQGYCEQRLKTVAVNQREGLIRIGFELPTGFLGPDIVNHLKLTVEACSEDGTEVRAEISVRPVAGSKVALTHEVLDEL